MPTIKAAARAIQRRERSAGTDLVGDMVSLLAAFTALFHGEDAARALVRRVFMNTSLLDESPLFQSKMREACAGGVAEGRAEGLRDAVRLAFEARFGPLGAEMLAALSAAGEAAPRDAITHLASDTVDQLRVRLTAGPS